MNPLRVALIEILGKLGMAHIYNSWRYTEVFLETQVENYGSYDGIVDHYDRDMTVFYAKEDDRIVGIGYHNEDLQKALREIPSESTSQRRLSVLRRS
jgi:hypothetical protein